MTTPIQVQPAILEKDVAHIQQKINLVKGLCATIHLDVMDGQFVPNTTVNDPAAIAHVDWGDLQISLHLMIKNPALYVRKWALPNVSTMVFHREASVNLVEDIKFIKQLGKRVGIAINPHTPTYDIIDYLSGLDEVLIMAVEPGFSAQAFNSDVLEKISYLRKINPTISIAVDGGVNGTTKSDIIRAGASIVCANSYIFNHPNIKEALTTLQHA